MDFRVFSRNISENMHARCVREDTKQALKENLQADGVQRRKPLVVRYCLKHNILRRMLAGMLAILCVAGSLPANVDGGALLGSTAIVAKAAYTDGTLIVGGTSVTSTTTSGTGWSFNTETNTLTFSEI